jgi:excisionase family DNA binding protein
MAVALEQHAIAAGHEPVLASENEAAALRKLDALLSQAPPPSGQLLGPDGEAVELPASVYRVLRQIVHELAKGHAVTVVPAQREVTTQQAADLLNVSRPHLVKLLERGAIPFHTVGTHRRIRFEDVMAYRRQRSHARREALAEMAREAQQMGLYE